MSALNGKIALVTGGSRGMGAAIAKRLAREGAYVAITYATEGDKAAEVISSIKTAGGRGIAIQADNRNAEAVTAAIDTVAAAEGHINILVNNAGIIDARPISELTLEDFDRTVDINVRGVFVATKSAVAHMPDGGRVITIGSNLASQVPWPGISLYALSKSALIGFTRGLARDLGERAITANIVHPGSTDTDMNPASGDMADAQRAQMAIPRYGDPADVASLVAWLAGPEARSVTGAEYVIDGGTNA
ncbi:3-oxoacyl-ACP reductase family protein [Roseinatronobacter sp. S2]|uniref:3-oxoacyl-ACP reductase family protein n=1 Tax=Roseinatronobacter sp. S2 TaxID=3035471 RepID=UPI00240EFD98|nr:3-oxoacyl-ACP reductase family protein [Roseinatronobacter sp. S2]WFE75331.1 3-oxoacyl-ACP reductase FabG [Roseinatronobacter sp. S2]